MSDDPWDDALTALEDELDEHEEAVRLGRVEIVPTWDPPEDLGPLPARHAERVVNLVKRIGLLSTFVQFQLLATENDLKHLDHRSATKGTHNRAMALFLDASV